MLVSKEEFKVLKQEGGGIRGVRAMITVNSNLGSGNIYVMSNGIFFEVTFKEKRFIAMDSIDNITINGVNLHISYETQEKLTLVCKSEKDAVKFYNEYALFNNLDSIALKDIKEQDKIRKREQFEKIMASNPEVTVKQSHSITKPKEEDNTVKCPKCGSTSITANKKGFGLAKGAAGVFLAGPYGAIAAGLGKNKILITCLNCGHKWKPGS